MFNAGSLREEGFSWELALSMAVASELAYQEDDTVLGHIVTETLGFDGCEPFAKHETQGFIAWNAHAVAICFRGTESIGDWIANLNILPESRPYGSVHSGFLDGYKDVEPRIRTILESASPEGKRVWLTGHSLGGALATVAGAELLGSLDISGIFTFGQPKSGNFRLRNFYAQNYPGRFHRVVNDDDIVPRVPPGFSHVGDRIKFDGSGELIDGPGDSGGMGALESVNGDSDELTAEEFKALQAQLIEMHETMEREAGAALAEGGELDFDESVAGFFPSFADHAIKNYIWRIHRRARGEVSDP